MNWNNSTGVEFQKNLADYLGFIYEIEMKDGQKYVGRKQFWRKSGKNWLENDWENYNSSSEHIKKHVEDIAYKTIIGVFSSKSAMRYAEAFAIIHSNFYLEEGLNWSFEGCKGTLRLTEEDRRQLHKIKMRYYNAML